MTGAAQVIAEERDFEKTLFGHEAELHGDGGEDAGGVHVAQMVGDEDVAALGIDLLEAFDLETNETDPEEHSRPGAGNRNLHPSGRLKERHDQIDGSITDGAEDDEWVDDDQRPQLRQHVLSLL